MDPRKSYILNTVTDSIAATDQVRSMDNRRSLLACAYFWQAMLLC